MEQSNKVEISPTILILIIVALIALIGVLGWNFLRPPSYAPSPGVVDGGPRPGDPTSPGFVPPSPGAATR
jgi:hypothetical protein